MAAFDTVGMILAGLLAFVIALHVTVVVGVLAYHHTREAFLRWREKRSDQAFQ